MHKLHEEMKVWSFEVGFQELASNHLKLLWSKAMVVSVKEKSEEIWQVRFRKTNKLESLLTRRKEANGIKTEVVILLQDKSTGNLITE